MLRNFSGGPGALPPWVLAQASQAIECIDEVGVSVLGISHRSDWFQAVVDEAQQNVRALLAVPSNYHVLFLQGGSTLQFSMIPMNLLAPGKTAAYLQTGYWSAKAMPEARPFGDVKTVWSGAAAGYARLPAPSQWQVDASTAYLHYVANETVEGLAFPYIPQTGEVPLMCDMSSSLMARPLDVSAFDLIYAHAQKNLGPAGVTLVIVKDALLKAHVNLRELPPYLSYQTHVDAGSIYNTPPVFSIYVLMLVTRWLLHNMGGLTRMEEVNDHKAQQVYAAIDRAEGFYLGHADKAYRSPMNCSFHLRDERLYSPFFEEAAQHSLVGLEGHRSLGGIRASLYNAVTEQDAQALAEFLTDFAHAHG